MNPALQSSVKPISIDGQALTGPRTILVKCTLQEQEIWHNTFRYVPTEIKPVTPLDIRPAKKGMNFE